MVKGHHSLIETLKHDGVPDPTKYVGFFSLRTHALSPADHRPCTEMIYIHSKTMIVDDSSFIVGSANINDRSMLGERDHEIAVFVGMPSSSE